MAPKGKHARPESYPGAWLGSEPVHPNSVYARMSLAERQRCRNWLRGVNKDREKAAKFYDLAAKTPPVRLPGT